MFWFYKSKGGALIGAFFVYYACTGAKCREITMERDPEFTDKQRQNHLMVSKILEAIMDLGKRVAAIEERLYEEDASRVALSHALGQETEH